MEYVYYDFSSPKEASSYWIILKTNSRFPQIIQFTLIYHKVVTCNLLQR